MAGLRGNNATVAFAKQTGRGTPNTTYTDAFNFTGGNIEPTREIDNLSETDSKRDAGDSYVRVGGAAGAPEFYLRTANAHHVLQAAFGTQVDSGVADPWTHTITLAESLSYYTFSREVSDTLFEQFDDCKVNELTVSAEAGSPLVATLDVVGRSATRLTAAPTYPASGSDTPQNFNFATVTLNGAATSLVGSFEFTLSQGVSVQQTDDVKPYDVVEGLREVTLGFSLIFETLDEYNKFHYGSAAGTAQAGTVFTTTADTKFKFDLAGATPAREIEFTFPKLAYEEFPVEPDPGGDPIVVDVRARAQRHANGLVSAVVKNGVAT